MLPGKTPLSGTVEKLCQVMINDRNDIDMRSDQALSLALLGPRATLRAVGLARLEPLEDALRVEHVTARDGRELVGGREELQAGGTADPHDDNLDLMGVKCDGAVGWWWFSSSSEIC